MATDWHLSGLPEIWWYRSRQSLYQSLWANRLKKYISICVLTGHRGHRGTVYKYCNEGIKLINHRTYNTVCYTYNNKN